MTDVSNKLPAGSANFHIEFGSKAQGIFTGCSGLAAAVEIVEHQGSGAQGKTVYQRQAGPPSVGEVTLKRARIPDDKQFEDWQKSSANGEPSSRVNGTVMVMTIDHQIVTTFNVINGWVRSYSLGDLKAGDNSVLEETIIIVHEGITLL